LLKGKISIITVTMKVNGYFYLGFSAYMHMMVVTNSEGRIIYANQVFLTRLRYSLEELTGKNFGGILSKNNHSKLCEFCQLNRS